MRNETQLCITVNSSDLMRHATRDKFTVHTLAVDNLSFEPSSQLDSHLLIRHYEIITKGIGCHTMKLPPTDGTQD